MPDEPKTQAYQVLARRFRPRVFDEVVGQDSVLASLRRALASERVPHAFLFAGSRGVGKTTLARIVARALNCEQGPSPDPCGTCRFCTGILEGSNSDVVEIDAASHNLVDDIRELRERVGFASMGSRYKVYILDEVHMLTRSAFNAFLKTLEEPPPKVVFMLATTELHKVPETIRSRCQVLMFHRVGEAEIVERLGMICRHEGLQVADEVLHEIAASARGGMRDAETALERVLPIVQHEAENFDIESYHRLFHRVGPGESVAVVRALLAGETRAALRFVENICQSGMDEREALGEVLQVLRAILMLKIDGPETGLIPFSGLLRESLVELSADADESRLDAMIQAGLIGRERIRRLDDRRLVLELSLLRMASAAELPLLAELVDGMRSGQIDLPAPAARSASAQVRPAAAGGDARGRLLAQVQGVKPMLVATLELCKFEGPEAGKLRLTLHSDLKMHRDRVNSQDFAQFLRGQVREVFGEDTELVLGCARSAADQAPEDPAPAKAVSTSKEPAKSGSSAAAAKTAEEKDSPAVESKPAEELKRPPGESTGKALRRVADKFDGQILEFED
ncbi:MAG: DNA polymerase III subunit gamma/tau [Planctomycetota bacterium]